jgi:hypothetical protein
MKEDRVIDYEWVMTRTGMGERSQVGSLRASWLYAKHNDDVPSKWWFFVFT